MGLLLSCMDYDLNEQEQYVLLLARLNQSDEFDSLDKFREVMELAQQGGKSGDPIDTKISAGFSFNGDFESTVDGLVDKGLLNLSGGSYEISADGHQAYRHERGVPIDDLNALKIAKRLYRVDR